MARINSDQARILFAESRVARLATVSADQRPHLVPITFAVHGDLVVTAVDHKPKTTTALRRVRNITDNPSVTLLADHYEDDWTRLWWVRADGTAELADARDYPDHVEALATKYPQYAANRPSATLILIQVSRWTGWTA